MQRKLFFILFVVIAFTINVKAESLHINNKNYSLNEDIKEESYEYYHINNTLVLNGYNGGYIFKDGDLNIILKGTNSISGINNSITATSINISGGGTLNINGEYNGLVADNIFLNDVTIKGSAKLHCIYNKNILDIRKSLIDIFCGGVFVLGHEYGKIDNSIVRAKMNYGFSYDKLGDLEISNSNLELQCGNNCFTTQVKTKFSNTKAMLVSNSKVVSTKNIKIVDNSYIEASNDNINFVKDDYVNYKYVKITPIVNEDIASQINRDSSIVEIENPKTYDNISKWIIIFMSSFIGIATILYIKVRNNESD